MTKGDFYMGPCHSYIMNSVLAQKGGLQIALSSQLRLKYTSNTSDPRNVFLLETALLIHLCSKLPDRTDNLFMMCPPMWAPCPSYIMNSVLAQHEALQIA